MEGWKTCVVVWRKEGKALCQQEGGSWQRGLSAMPAKALYTRSPNSPQGIGRPHHTRAGDEGDERGERGDRVLPQLQPPFEIRGCPFRREASPGAWAGFAVQVCSDSTKVATQKHRRKKEPECHARSLPMEACVRFRHLHTHWPCRRD